jgi:hypothetical protein
LVAQKHEYSTIYTERHEPEPTRYELPVAGERGMLPGIMVQLGKGISKTEKLNPMSRICYSRIYTFEYNLKVEEFGRVHKEFTKTLKSNFDTTLATLGEGEPEREDGAVYPQQTYTGKGKGRDESDANFYEQNTEQLPQLVEQTTLQEYTGGTSSGLDDDNSAGVTASNWEFVDAWCKGQERIYFRDPTARPSKKLGSDRTAWIPSVVNLNGENHNCWMFQSPTSGRVFCCFQFGTQEPAG